MTLDQNQRRHEMTAQYFPEATSLEEFLESMHNALRGFRANAVTLQHGNDRTAQWWNESHLIEEWFECFARWSEIQSEGFDPFKARS